MTNEISALEHTEPLPARPVLCVIIPVYNNAASIGQLLEQLEAEAARLPVSCHLVFVVDGSPDESTKVLRSALEDYRLPSTLVVLSRNFGAFAAIRTGLEHAEGDYFAVLAADLQEPPELLGEFVEQLGTGQVDLVLGERRSRQDPLWSRLSSSTFWWLYRRIVQPSMPAGGVDVFACNEAVRTTIVQLREANTSLVGQLLWIGFRRTSVSYDRRARTIGKSSWTLRKKLRYMSDSIFAFTDLPIRLLLFIGFLGSIVVTVVAAVVLFVWIAGWIDVAGYTPLMLAILAVGFVVTLGLGIVGSYLSRAYENTKDRPLSITQSTQHFRGDG